jgi:hypothetical protein
MCRSSSSHEDTCLVVVVSINLYRTKREFVAASAAASAAFVAASAAASAACSSSS